jgi:hypothetical protein
MAMAKVLNGMVSALLRITKWRRVIWRVTFSSSGKVNTALKIGSYSYIFSGKNYCIIFKSILKTKWYKITVNTVLLSTVDMTEALKIFETKNIHSLFNI